MNKKDFRDLEWGVATSSYQIEGAYKKDGKGLSVWDTFSQKPNKIKNNENGNIACNHYNLWKDDVKLLSELGVDNYRFSISWPRIFPTGLENKVNSKGIDFYSKLIDELLSYKITPFITLNHWDIPQGIEDIGGWTNRTIIDLFMHYAYTISNHFGDRVKKWITHNEPWCISNNGYLTGNFPPGIKNNGSKYFASIHHLLLSHGKSVPIIKSNSKDSEVGITLNLCPSYPASNSEYDKKACNLFDGKFNRLFLDPIYKAKYPQDILDHFIESNLILEEDLKNIHQNDLFDINTKIDFLGVNYYSRAIIRDNNISKEKNQPITTIKSSNKTSMGWEIYPKGLYDILLKINKDYDINSIYITESGCAFNTNPDKNGDINDQNRIKYHNDHIKELNKAIDKGVPCKGYFAWSLMDNFEWCEGYSQRFGLIWIDYNNQIRTPKNSFYWYKKMIQKEKTLR